MNSILEQANERNEDAEEGEVGQVPKYLGKVLDVLRQRRTTDNDLYNDFLIYASRAKESCELQKFPVEASYKLVGSIPPEKAANQENKNDTLILIFDFYARIKNNKSSKTFSDALLSLQTMNFSKMEVFCRDFQIIPKLLTREDLKTLWEEIGKEHVLKGLGVFTVVDFTEFKDLLVRMALWAYYKPGLKKMILNVEGFVPKPTEIVQYFCTYLHLFDDEYIHHFLRTVGRKTQGDYNYRSKEEVNLRTKIEVRTDTNARSMKQVSRVGGGGGASVASKLSANSATKINAYGEKEKNTVEIRPADPRRVISDGKNKTTSALPSHPEKKSSREEIPVNMRDRFEALRANDTRFTAHSLNNNNNGNNNNLGDSNNFGDSFDHHHSNYNTSGKKKNQHSVTIQEEGRTGTRGGTGTGMGMSGHTIGIGRTTTAVRSYYNDGRDEADDDSVDSAIAGMGGEGGDEDGENDSQGSLRQRFADNSLEALKEIYSSHYDPRLAVDLAQYCYVPPRTIVIDWIPTFAPMVDLGLLEAGMKVTINFRVVNESGDDVFVDFTTKNFQSEDTDIKTLTKPLIPGMSRIVTVSFTVPSRKMTVLCFFEVYLLGPRNAMKGMVQCPVFYYVDPGLSQPIFPTCNGRALNDLLVQRLYCNGTPSDLNTRRLTTSFQTKKNPLDGSWKHSLKGFDITRATPSTLPLSSGGGSGGSGSRGLLLSQQSGKKTSSSPWGTAMMEPESRED
jgi:hypothetical protein